MSSFTSKSYSERNNNFGVLNIWLTTAVHLVMMNMEPTQQLVSRGWLRLHRSLSLSLSLSEVSTTNQTLGHFEG